MTQAVSSPLPMYLGLDGKPLSNGRLYFGAVGLNPETNPVAMYWDAALTQPAAQPIRTVNGMPSRNGTPALLYTNTDHSLTIKDSRGRLVLYARNSVEYSLEAQLANTSDALFGAGGIGYNPALAYAAGTVGYALNQRTAVFATGVAATDDAAIQAAIDAAPVNGVIDLFGNFASNVAKNLKPELLIRGVNGTITHSNAATNCFQYIPGGSLGFPGRITFDRVKITGPNSTVGAETLGTQTWTNLKAGIFIEANCPFVNIVDCDIRGMFAQVVLRNCYQSCISGYFFGGVHGVMLYAECHDTIMSGITDGQLRTGFSCNYGNPAGKVSIMQGIQSLNGAHQIADVGLWLESTQGFSGVGTLYFEGNRIRDIQVGVADGGAYGRSANFTRIQGIGSSSPVNQPSVSPLYPRPRACNVEVAHSTDVYLRGAGFYSGEGGPSTTENFIVDGFSDRVHIELAVTQSTTPYFWDGTAQSRTTVSRAGRTNYPRDMTAGLTYGVHGSATPHGRGPWYGGGPSGRESIILEALLANTDLLFRVNAATGQARFYDSAGAELFSVDALNYRLNCYRPIVMPVYTVAALNALPASATPEGARAYVTDATSAAFGAALAGGGANRVPVFRDNSGWKIG